VITCHKTFLLQTVYDPSDRAGIDHNVFGDLGGWQRTVFIESQEAGELRGTDLVLLIEFFIIYVVPLHESSDQPYDFLDGVLANI
jgi:hypothetical protein